MSRHFFFVLPSKRRKQRSEKNTRVCSTPRLMESCWKVHFEVLFGARGGFIFCSSFLFHDRKSGRFSRTEKRVRAPRRIALRCSHQHGEMFVITPANVHRAHSTPPRQLQYAQFTLCVKPTWVTLSSVTPLLSLNSRLLSLQNQSLRYWCSCLLLWAVHRCLGWNPKPYCSLCIMSL